MSLSQVTTQQLVSKNPYNKYHQQHAMIKGATLAKKQKSLIWNQLPKHSMTTPANYRVQEISYKGTLKTLFGQTNIVDVDIPDGTIELLENFDISVTLANSESTSGHTWTSTLQPFYWFKRIEVRQGTKVLKTILPEDIRDYYFIVNDDLRDRQVKATPYAVNSATYVSSASVAISSSSTFYIRLPTALEGLYLENINNLNLKCTFEDIANVSSNSYNGSITVTDFKLIATDIQVDEASKVQLRADNLSGCDRRILIATNEEKIVSLGTSSTTVKIEGFDNNPYVAFATFEVKDLSSYQYNRETRLAITSFTFENQNNSSTDGITWTDTTNRLFLAPKSFPTNSFFTQATYPYMYLLPGGCLDIKKSLESGVHTGGICWPEKMQLKIIAPSSYANHTLLLRVWTYAHLRVQGGQIKIM